MAGRKQSRSKYGAKAAQGQREPRAMRRGGRSTSARSCRIPKYGSRLVAKFVNMMMTAARSRTAERIMYDALDSRWRTARKQDALKLFKSAVDNVKPAVEVKSRRVGGSTYQVPVEVRPDRRTSLGMRWLIGAARPRPEKTHGGASWPASCWTRPTTAGRR